MDSSPAPAGSIVVGVDGSPASEDALDWAATQAALEQRPLVIVHAVEPVGFPTVGTYVAGVDYGAIMDEARNAATNIVAHASSRALDRHPGLDVHRVLADRDPRTTLLDLAERAELVVVGSRGRGPVSSLLLGSVSVSVSKHAACPVVVRRPGDATRPKYGILVGVDGTEHSMPAIEFAYRMASLRSRPLTVLHCYWDAASAAATWTGTAVPDLGDEEALVAESIAGMAEKFPEVAVEVRLVHGFADQHLVTASYNYDLLVVGHHRITPLQDLFYGSVAPAVVEHAHGAVAVVPSALLTPPVPSTTDGS